MTANTITVTRTPNGAVVVAVPDEDKLYMYPSEDPRADRIWRKAQGLMP